MLKTLLLAAALLQNSNAWLSNAPRSKIYSSRPNRPSRLSAESSREEKNYDDSTKGVDHEMFMVEVSYDGRTISLPISSQESILTALERSGVSDRLAIPELPSECRRGNCLTCAGRHTSTSSIQSLQREDDGLSPLMSKEVEKRGYVLTCSSRVVGEGLKLQLGESHRAWTDVYMNRIKEESTQYLGREAVARTIRKSDERNPQRWAKETETALEKSDDL